MKLWNNKEKKVRKYIVLFSLVVLSACAGTNVDNGLTKLESEPKNCEFLYNMNSKFTAYKQEEAYNYLEKDILEQHGDSYYIISKDVLENQDAVFGPKYTFKFKTKIYRCKK